MLCCVFVTDDDYSGRRHCGRRYSHCRSVLIIIKNNNNNNKIIIILLILTNYYYYWSVVSVSTSV